MCRDPGDTLVHLHALDLVQVGLRDFGRPTGYLERQLRLWRRQWDRVATRDLPDLDTLHRRLDRALDAGVGGGFGRTTLPPVRASIVHGDCCGW